MSSAQYPIKLAAQRAGLSPHVVRIWEKRYGAVSPVRSETRRRLYSRAEVERLALLRAVTQSGHRIGDVARLSDDELRTLLSEFPPGREFSASQMVSPGSALEKALTAVKRMDAEELEVVLDQCAVSFGHHGLLENVIGPLAKAVGEFWRDGEITAAHEHFFSGVILNYLLNHFKSYAESEHAPRLIVVTPVGQLHELGAAIVVAAARDIGWRVIYLGANLPATEIAGAAIQHKASAVALSIVFPGDDPSLPGELEYLRKLVPADIDILVGGRAAPCYSTTLEKIGAFGASDLEALYGYLEKARMPDASG